jgi:UDP-N-acetylglucosamine--N-acetylmuramyl-(pentapeptide) pyrophosphoryl-undecaprenol N-acetylglucosamine transferase
MKLMIAGGGTGGHLFPGVALAQTWMQRAPEAEVFFVGTARGLESKVVPQAGFRLHLIEQRGLKRLGLVQTLKALLMLPRSFLQSLRIVRKEHPNVALGVGGYAAGPAMMAAWLLGVPTLILEPNAMPGLTNRLLGWVARKIVSPYERAAQHFGRKKLITAGIPVRGQIIDAMKRVQPRTDATPTVLVFGGSQGAQAINKAVREAAPGWIKDGIRLIHQTGPGDFAATKQFYDAQGLQVDVREFITDMAAVYEACDLVVCRAGASTLAELALVKKPAILVPLPTAADDHQTKNAQAFAAVGAGVHLPQRELGGEVLGKLVRELLADKPRLAAMAQKAQTLGDEDAAQNLCNLCLELAA